VTLKLSPVSEAHKFETYPFPELRHPKSWEFLQLRSSQTKAIQRVENSSLLNVETQNSRVFSILENVFYLAKDEAVKNLTAFARETLSAFVIW
jgi:hypothetical protein